MDVDKLILLVRDNEAIYNIKHPKHRERNFIDGIWRNIAKELNTNEHEVKTKWQQLRSNFMREKRKLKDICFGSDTNSTSRITWRYYNSLLFLDSTLRLNATIDNVRDIDILNVEDNFKNMTDSQIEIHYDLEKVKNEELSECSLDRKIENRKPTKKRVQPIDDDLDLQYESPLKQFTRRSDADDDSDLLFLKSLHSNMRQLGPIENLEFRVEVMNLLKKKLQITNASTQSSSDTL